jgi:hypothetical protein
MTKALRETTMEKFVYRFGYCTPMQWEANEAHGWDDESSGAFVVYADTRDAALRWGHEVAGAFVAWLFEVGGQLQPRSWAESHFAAWIEEIPTPAFSEEGIQALPVVLVGQMPDFGDWKSDCSVSGS